MVLMCGFVATRAFGLASEPKPHRLAFVLLSCAGMTRGDLLTHCISYSLIRARKIVKGLSLGLSQEERQAVAQRAVDELRRNGDQWKLDEELPKADEVHSTPKDY
jgi:hypothetical protein